MRKILTIVGSTSSGKTELALRLAGKTNGEIVSADSRQVYKYLDIGTAKPAAEQRAGTAFHLVDFLEPDRVYSCGQFGRDAQDRIRDILGRGRAPIVCGGTGLYLGALYEPLHRLPGSTADSKRKVLAELEAAGLDEMYRRLQKADPAWAGKVGPADRQRILRGLEIYYLTGRPISEFFAGPRPAPEFEPHYIGLKFERADLYQRIDRRFDRMLKDGLVEETRAVLGLGFAPDCPGLRTIGYQEIIAHLHGRLSLSEAAQLAKKNTRNFARRQATWFRKVKGIVWLDGRKPADELMNEVMKLSGLVAGSG